MRCDHADPKQPEKRHLHLISYPSYVGALVVYNSSLLFWDRECCIA